MTQPREETFDGAHGVRIFYRSWQPEGRPRAVLVICHGVNSHGGQYIWVAEQFAADGYAVYALDLRGRGDGSAGGRDHDFRRRGHRPDRAEGVCAGHPREVEIQEDDVDVARGDLVDALFPGVHGPDRVPEGGQHPAEKRPDSGVLVNDEDYRLIHLRKKATEFLPSVHYHEVPTVCQANSPGVRRPDARAGPTGGAPPFWRRFVASSGGSGAAPQTGGTAIASGTRIAVRWQGFRSHLISRLSGNGPDWGKRL